MAGKCFCFREGARGAPPQAPFERLNDTRPQRPAAACSRAADDGIYYLSRLRHKAYVVVVKERELKNAGGALAGRGDGTSFPRAVVK
jgi:hypothetical protein